MMISLEVLIVLFLAAVAVAASTSLIHSLRCAWNAAGRLALASRNPHFDTVRVEWRDLEAKAEPKVVQMRPRLTRRNAQVSLRTPLRAAA